MDEKTFCVYAHINNFNGKIYVGQTIHGDNPNKRFRDGKGYIRNNNKLTSFGEDIIKYGWDNFSHVILVNNLTESEARKAEIYYIKYFESNNPNNGYNNSHGGEGGKIYDEHPKGMLNKHHTKEWKEEHSNWAKDHNNNCMNNGQVIWDKTHPHPRGMKGKKHNPQSYAKISKRYKLVLPDGTEIEFDSGKKVMKHLNIGGSIFDSMLKGPYEIKKNNSSKNKRYDLVGYRLYKI